MTNTLGLFFVGASWQYRGSRWAVCADRARASLSWRPRRVLPLAAAGIGVTLWMCSPGAWAQSTPEISIAITGRHSRVPGSSRDNAVLLQVEFREGRGYPAGGTSGPATDVSGTDRNELLLVQAERELESAPLADVPLDPLERDEVPPVEPRSASGRDRGPKTKPLAEASHAAFVLSSKFVESTIQAALSAQGILPTLQRLEGMASRAKLSAILPEVRFRAGRDVDQSLRLSPTDEDPTRYTQTGGVSFVLEGQATFRLTRLVFATEELGIERLVLAQARERQRVTEGVVDELLRWQQAYRVLASNGLVSSRVEAELFESMLRLDVLTGGWFSVHAPGDPAVSRPVKPVEQPAPRPRPGESSALDTSRGRKIAGLLPLPRVPADPEQRR